MSVRRHSDAIAANYCPLGRVPVFDSARDTWSSHAVRIELEKIKTHFGNNIHLIIYKITHVSIIGKKNFFLSFHAICTCTHTNKNHIVKRLFDKFLFITVCFSGFSHLLRCVI